MTMYRTVQGDVLDAICRNHLGSESYTVQVLAANSGLAALGPIYPAGIVINFPDVSTVVAPPTIRLWGKA